MQQNVQITYALYKAVTNIIQRGEFYIIIFLNKLKKVENTPPPIKNENNQNKTSMAKAMGPFRDSQAPSLLSGLMYRLNPPLIGPMGQK